MARIRTVKPEFWASEQMANCTRDARLLFIGLWTFCDDAGIHPASPTRLRLQVFPGDSITDNDVKSWIYELLTQKLIFEYTANDHTYWQVTGWRHQLIKKPCYKYPTSTTPVPQQYVTGSAPITDPPSTELAPTHPVNRDRNINRENIRQVADATRHDAISKDYLLQIVEAFNKSLADLPNIKVLSEKRMRSLRDLISRHKRAEEISWWIDYFDKVKGSGFLMGKTSKWRANFDFLIKYDNMLKIIEGTYEQNN